MLTYKLDDNGNAVQMDDLNAWAQWLVENQSNLIIAKDDIRDHRNKFLFSVITRFRGQVGPRDDLARPPVWVTEGTNGEFFGATATRDAAKNWHDRTVRVMKNRYKKH